MIYDDKLIPDAPGALFEEVIAKRSNLDMHTKMREDPLYAIRYTVCTFQQLLDILIYISPIWSRLLSPKLCSTVQRIGS